MEAHKAFKYRIYPTAKQREFLVRQFGAVRFIYNRFLFARECLYAFTGKGSSYFTDSGLLTTLKHSPGYEWLQLVPNMALRGALKDLDNAFKNFFAKRAKHPKFKKRTSYQSFRIDQHFCIEDGKLYIPKLKTGIKVIQDRSCEGRALFCTVSLNPAGEYYASITCEIETKPAPKLKQAVGIDLGIKDFITTSNAQKTANPKPLNKLTKKLKYEQRQLAKKQKGSKNRQKQRRKVARLHQYIANSRKDFQQKLSTNIINENQVVILENLNVEGMKQNHKLAGAIGDAGWYSFTEMLRYKAEWAGKTIFKVDTFFPSSKTCHECGHKNANLTLNQREWDCENCGKHLDRDVNAAKNILREGLKQLLANKVITKKEFNAYIRHSSVCGTHADANQKLVEAPVRKRGRRNKKPPSVNDNG